MSRSEKIMRGKLSIRSKKGGISIGKDTVRLLGNPTHICILKSENKQSIAIVPCSGEHPMSFKVPEKLFQNPKCMFEIYSLQFVRELLLANDLDNGGTYRIEGDYSEEQKAVIFPLKVI